MRKTQLLAAFCGIRGQCAKRMGEYFEQDLLAEQLKGRAEYTGSQKPREASKITASRIFPHFLLIRRHLFPRTANLQR